MTDRFALAAKHGQHFAVILPSKAIRGEPVICAGCGKSFQMVFWLDPDKKCYVQIKNTVDDCIPAPLGIVAAKLLDLDACSASIRWLVHDNQFATFQEAWDACDEPSWMLWLIARTMGNDLTSSQRLRLIKLLLDLTKILVKDTDDLQRAFSIIENWSNGQATVGECEIAFNISHAYAYKCNRSMVAASVALCVYSEPVTASNLVDTVIQYVGSSFVYMTNLVRQHFPEPPAF